MHLYFDLPYDTYGGRDSKRLLKIVERNWGPHVSSVGESRGTPHRSFSSSFGGGHGFRKSGHAQRARGESVRRED